MTDNVLTQKISKLLPRLASEFDGEVVATARAIDRTLQGAGHDWHKLAEVVEKFGDIVLGKPVTLPPIKHTAWPTKPSATPKPKPSPRWNSISRARQLAWLDLLSIDGSKILCGGLPHAGYASKFRGYRQRIVNGGTVNEDEINLINRWVKAFWNQGARP